MDIKHSAAAMKAAGYPIHHHQGVWWQNTAPGFCKPLDSMQILVPGSTRPSLFASWMGYSHLIDPSASGNHSWDVLMLDENCLCQFELTRITPKRKQQKIKQALRSLEVKQIDDIVPCLPSMAEICVTTAERTGHGKSAEYYSKHRRTWERSIAQASGMPGREWWGAFYQGQLIAYYHLYSICRTLYVGAAKSHTEFLHLCPNDAIIFSFLNHHRAKQDCSRVIYGEWAPDVPSLNEFKQRFGFVRKVFPVHRVASPLLWLTLKLRKQIRKPPTNVATRETVLPIALR